ncbi:septum formation protein [Paenibacillus sophorae]|uniref:dTTP/UTP pyrophosphatase n=1 Tax=Paenibacillus sophorae TaxID=1333845 RepID=A0A1H8QLH1_9BACL|nr:Maf family protein [Paenibacillus sophorae]QWU15093.1 Maf family protein [Paenibacillus sophorae]SEO54663.1 septum formation protein [Paenibacillus sophorae]
MNDNSITSIILASGSPRRRELLSLLGLPFDVIPSEADESFLAEWEPEQIVSALALRKAEAVLPLAGERNSVILGSDTIVVLEGRILGKPADPEEARHMLSSLQGRSHTVFTGVACIKIRDGVNGDALRQGKSTGAALVKMAAPAFTSLGKLGSKDKTGGGAVRLGGIGQYRVLSESPSGEPAVMAGYTESRVTFRPMSAQEIDGYIKTGEPMDKAGSYGIQGIGSLFIEKIEGDFYSIMGLPLNLLYRMLLEFGINPLKV